MYWFLQHKFAFSAENLVTAPFPLMWQAMSVLRANVRQKVDGAGATACLQDNKDRSLGG